MSNKLDKISETPYLNNELNLYLRDLRKVTSILLTKYDDIPSKVIEAMTSQIWTATKFLAGSTSKNVPYEIVYCLKKSLGDWTHKSAIVTTALTQDKNYSFYFEGIPPDFYSLAKTFTGITFNGELVQLAFPEIYQHRPLLNVALYHELGHFIDIHHGIVNNLLLGVSSYDELALPKIDFNKVEDIFQKQSLALSHLREYFSDLFAVSYVGNAYMQFLVDFAGNHPASFTHPATEDRLELMTIFLSGKPNNIVELFQKSLAALNLNKLEVLFSEPDISDSFQNTRPYNINNEGELHGIFSASTNYLSELTDEKDKFDTERIINNLVEKSIRNSMIVDQWGSHESIT